MILTSGTGQESDSYFRRRSSLLPHTHTHTSDDTSDNTLPDSHPLNLRTLTHTHTHTHQTTPQMTCPTAPSETNTQNLRTITPILEVRTPITKTIWGKKHVKLRSDLWSRKAVWPGISYWCTLPKRTLHLRGTFDLNLFWPFVKIKKVWPFEGLQRLGNVFPQMESWMSIHFLSN